MFSFMDAWQPPVHFIADNKHYCAAVTKDDAPNPGRGFSGAEFTIVFPDGRVLISRDVWWVWDMPAAPETPHAQLQENWPPTFQHGWQKVEVQA